MKDVDNAIMRLSITKGHDEINNKNTSFVFCDGPCFPNVLCKLISKFISHDSRSSNVLLGNIGPIVKNLVGNVTSSSNYTQKKTGPHNQYM